MVGGDEEGGTEGGRKIEGVVSIDGCTVEWDAEAAGVLCECGEWFALNDDETILSVGGKNMPI